MGRKTGEEQEIPPLYANLNRKNPLCLFYKEYLEVGFGLNIYCISAFVYSR